MRARGLAARIGRFPPRGTCWPLPDSLWVHPAPTAVRGARRGTAASRVRTRSGTSASLAAAGLGQITIEQRTLLLLELSAYRALFGEQRLEVTLCRLCLA